MKKILTTVLMILAAALIIGVIVFTVMSNLRARDDGKTYIAAYRSSTETWKVMGKAYYVSDQVSVWLSGLASQYEASEWVLNRIGDPAPEVETESTEG